MSDYVPPEDRVLSGPDGDVDLHDQALIIIRNLMFSSEEKAKRAGLDSYMTYLQRVGDAAKPAEPPWSPEYIGKAMAEFCRFFGEGGLIDRNEDGYALRPLEPDIAGEFEVTDNDEDERVDVKELFTRESE